MLAKYEIFPMKLCQLRASECFLSQQRIVRGYAISAAIHSRADSASSEPRGFL